MVRPSLLLACLGVLPAACEGVIDVADMSVNCVATEAIDCADACARLPHIQSCLGKAMLPIDPATCPESCEQAKRDDPNRASAYGCLDVFTGNCSELARCVSACRTTPGGTCDPGLRGPCLDSEVCDAKTSTCVPIPICEDDGDCSGGFSCKVYQGGLACYGSCSDGRGEPEDALCQITHVCDEQTFLCAPWRCVTAAAQLDCSRACAALADACAKSCPPARCQMQPGCMSGCTQAKASGDPRQIAAYGCLQIAHGCMSFDYCESSCVAPLPDGGAGD